MATWDDVRRLALTLPQTAEELSHGTASWRVHDSATLFTTPHFDGFPAVLVRLDRVAVADLTELITDAWLARAPVRLAQDYLAAGR